MWVLRTRSLVLVLGLSFQTSGVFYLTMSNLQAFGTICALKAFTIHISSLELLPWTLHLCVQLPSAFSHGYPTNILNLFLWPLPPQSLPPFFLLCSWKLHYPTARKSLLLFLLSRSTFIIQLLRNPHCFSSSHAPRSAHQQILLALSFVGKQEQALLTATAWSKPPSPEAAAPSSWFCSCPDADSPQCSSQHKL